MRRCSRTENHAFGEVQRLLVLLVSPDRGDTVAARAALWREIARLAQSAAAAAEEGEEERG